MKIDPAVDQQLSLSGVWNGPENKRPKLVTMLPALGLGRRSHGLQRRAASLTYLPHTASFHPGERMDHQTMGSNT